MRNSHQINQISRRPNRQDRTLASAGGAVMRIVHRRPAPRRVAPRRVAAGAGALGVLLLAAACSSSSASPTSGSSSSVINGAGSTFAAPMYQQWAGQYHQSVNKSAQINYQAIGSGGGISEFTQGVVDFGATDAPMTGTEKAAAQAGQGSVVLHIPMIIGAVALAYNEPGLTSLTLDGPTLANIYLGTISKWNDPAIKKLNPGVKLPSDAIQPVERADSSGTSYAFSSYLTAISPAWASKVGASKAPAWPVGTGLPEPRAWRPLSSRPRAPSVTSSTATPSRAISPSHRWSTPPGKRWRRPQPPPTQRRRRPPIQRI